MSRTSYLRRPLTALLLAAAVAASVLMAVVVLASPAWAATYTVKNNADSGKGSLRQAIINADATTGVADTINFASSVSGQTITLTSAQLPTITDGAGLTIDGGSADITISGANQYGVFEVGSGAMLTLNNLTVANGANANAEGGGGGIYNGGGTLEVSNSTLSGNSAANGGGGIANEAGTATVSNSTISSNSAPDGSGGGIVSDMSGGSTVTVSNSTLSGNSAGVGGGIYNGGGMLEVSNSTLSSNSANDGYGGGIYSGGGTVTFKNTIVANSPSGGSCYENGAITNGGYNPDSENTCFFGTNNNSLSGVDPMLGPLADNGGPTKTHALLAGSPAIDKGNSFGATTDQRGVARPQGAASDMGAFEVEDTINPRVSTATPTGAGIGRGTNVVATFTEKMSPTSITNSTFKLYKLTSSGTTQVTNVTVTLGSNGLKATLNP